MLAKDREENVAAYEIIKGKVLSFLKILSNAAGYRCSKVCENFRGQSCMCLIREDQSKM